MKFIRSRIDKNEIIMYYKTEDEEQIIEKKFPFHKLPPLTHKSNYKESPPNSVSAAEIF